MSNNKKESIFAISMLLYCAMMMWISTAINLSDKYAFVLNLGTLYLFATSMYMLFEGLDVKSFLLKMKMRKIRREIYGVEDDVEDEEEYEDNMNPKELFKDEVGIMRINTPKSPLKCNLKSATNVADAIDLPKRRRYVRHISFEDIATFENHCEKVEPSEKVEEGQSVISKSYDDAHEKNENMQTVTDLSTQEMSEKTNTENQTLCRHHRRLRKEKVTSSIAVPAACEKISERAKPVSVHCDNSTSSGKEAVGSLKKCSDARKKIRNAVLRPNGEDDRNSIAEYKSINHIPIKLVISPDLFDGRKFTICFSAA